MESYVFSFLSQKLEKTNPDINSKDILSRNADSSTHLKDSTSVNILESDNMENLSVESKIINVLPRDSNPKNLGPKHRFSLSNKPISLRDGLTKRTSELHNHMIENNLSTIKENVENSYTEGSNENSITSSSKFITYDCLKDIQSEEPLRDSIFQKLLGLYPQECTCQDILSLKHFLNETGMKEEKLQDLGKSAKEVTSSLSNERKIYLKERLTWYGEIFMSLIVDKNLFDMNVFVLILRKFVHIFFTQHQPLKLFKMLSTQVSLTRINNSPFAPCPRRTGSCPITLKPSARSLKIWLKDKLIMVQSISKFLLIFCLFVLKIRLFFSQSTSF
jgi:hypothetical protein